MTDAVFTIMSSMYDLTQVRGIKKVMEEAGYPTSFPITIVCVCKQSTLVIRALDDFPYMSKQCPECGHYLVKLVKVENGKEEIL